MSDVKPLLHVSTCSHGKANDGGFSAVLEGCLFSFPGCGYPHQATRDKYEIDDQWIEEQAKLKVLQERAAVARAARFGNAP